MRIWQQFLLGVAAAIAMASAASADVTFSPRPEGNYSTQRNIALLVGVHDDIGTDFSGDTIAWKIASYFDAYYGPTFIGVTRAGDSGAPYSSELIRQWIDLVYHNDYYDGLIDNYIFYITGHGGKQTVSEPNRIRIGRGFDGQTDLMLTDLELADYLKSLPDDVNKIVIIDSCYSGGFIDELKELDNLAIVTSASASSKSAYMSDGIPYFSREIVHFLEDRAGQAFTFDQLVSWLRYNFWRPEYAGMKAYELEAGDELELTSAEFELQVYQSPRKCCALSDKCDADAIKKYKEFKKGHPVCPADRTEPPAVGVSKRSPPKGPVKLP